MVLYVYVIITALVSTIVFELIGMLLLGIRNKKDLALNVLVNLITNPLLNFTMLFCGSQLMLASEYLNGVNPTVIYWTLLIILEIMVVLIEYILYKKYLSSKKNPFLLSLSLNILSFVGGLICQNLLHLF